MDQIKLTPVGVLSQLDYKMSDLQNMSQDQLRNTMISALTNFSNQPASVFQQIPEDENGTNELVVKVGIVAFLWNSGLGTADELKKVSTEDHLSTLIDYNHRYTNTPLRRLQLITPQQNLQLGLIWLTKYDMTLLGLCSMMTGQSKSALEKLSKDELRNTLIVELSKRSSQPVSYFQAIQSNDILVGKAAIIMFIKRANWKNDEELKRLATEQQRKLVEKETHLRTGIPSHFLGTDFNADWRLQFLNPLSDQQLVEMSNAWFVIDKPYAKYNEITSAMAHDSHTGTPGELPPGNPKRPYQDQNHPIQDQLASGIRTVRISSTSGADLRHSRTQFDTLASYLENVVTYFKNTATEDVFTIIDESAWSDTVKNTYTSGLGDLLFTPGQDEMPSLEELQNGNWPTLKKMVEKGKRVVLFVNTAYDTNIPWRLPAYDVSNFLISMDKDDYTLQGNIATSEMKYPNIRPYFNEVKNSKPLRYKTGNPLYLLNHYFYIHVSIIVGFNTSFEAFDKYGVGEQLIEYSMNAWGETQQKPNFINVDFYALEGKANYLFDLVLAMNRPDALGPYETVSKIERPINITNANELEIGQVYTISCLMTGKNGTTFNITRDNSNQAVSLQPADANSPQQYWKLIYNTPYPGIALVDPYESVALFDPYTDDPNRSPKPFKPMYCVPFQKGEKANSFAMFQNDNYLQVYNDRTYDEVMNLSILEVSGVKNNVEAGNTIGRWEDNKGSNQRWKFNKQTLSPFVPPALPVARPTSPPASNNSYTDPRDGKVYPLITFTIDGKEQTWFAANFDYNSSGSWENKTQEVGRLYNWKTALAACPKGWHLPSHDEFSALIRHFGTESLASAALIKGGKSGFNAQLAGWYGEGKINSFDDKGSYWTSTENLAPEASDGGYSLYISVGLVGFEWNRKEYGLSVRYIKDY